MKPDPGQSLIVQKWNLHLKASVDPSLSRAELLCLSYLLERYNQKTKSAWPSFNRISKDLGISARHVSRIIKNLKKRKYLKVQSGTRTTSNRYFPNFILIEGWKIGWCEKPELARDKAGGTDTQVSTVLTPMSGGVLTPMSDKPSSLEPYSSNTHTDRPPDPAQNSGASLQAESVCVKQSFLNSVKSKPQKRALTEYEQDVINHTLKTTEGIKNISAYKRELEKAARDGELDATAYEQDERWMSAYKEKQLLKEAKQMWDEWSEQQQMESFNYYYMILMDQEEQDRWIDKLCEKFRANTKDFVKRKVSENGKAPTEFGNELQQIVKTEIDRKLSGRAFDEWEGHDDLVQRLWNISLKVFDEYGITLNASQEGNP